MLILLTILVVLSAGALLAVFVKRRNSNLLEQNPPKTLAAEHFRPLFQPTEDEIRAFEQAENAKLEANKLEEERRVFEEKIGRIYQFEENWRISPDKRKTVELLLLASNSESAEIFSQITESIIKLWRENRIDNLRANDLADLLDSHFRLLPQQERTSGACFWLKEEIKNLRFVSQRS